MKNNISAKKLCWTALFTCITVICSWISIPVFTIAFTLQLLAVCLTAFCLGVGYSMLSLTTYLLLGICGLPVFSGFNSGAGVLLGPTGGYIIGFFPMCLIIALGLKICGDKFWVKIIFAIFGLVVCYAFGTVWFVLVYSQHTEISYFKALTLCVFPFVIFDLIKIFIAAAVSKKIKRFFNN